MPSLHSRLLQFDQVENILSFKDARLLIDVIGLLGAAQDLNAAIFRGGGAPAWIRRGKTDRRVRPQGQARTGAHNSLPKEVLDNTGNDLAVVVHKMQFNGTIERVNEYLRPIADQFESVRVGLDSGLIV
jgi:hypothetical protein